MNLDMWIIVNYCGGVVWIVSYVDKWEEVFVCWLVLMCMFV